jgi:dTDP-4-dehydrorhamnose reductase
MHDTLLLLDSPDTLIVGRHGRLGSAFAHFLPRAKNIDKEDVDIGDLDSVSRAIEVARPSLVINCAAITDLALCERDPIGTRIVNVQGVANLARVSRTAGAMFVHFSSDYACNPVNEYARGKLDSEKYGDLTVRAKIYDGSHWAWGALLNGRRIRMSVAEFSNPISTTSVVNLLPVLLRMNLRGVVPLGTKDRLSFFQVGQTWADALGKSLDLVEPTGRVESPYARPSDTFMPVEDLLDAGIEIPSLAADALAHRRYFVNYATKTDVRTVG